MLAVGSSGDVSGAGAGAGQWPVSGRRQVFLMDGSSIPIPPDCQCQCHPLLSQNSQHLHQKSILSIALLPPQPDEGRTEGKFGHQSKTLKPSLNLLTQSFRIYFSIYFCSLSPCIMALNLLFNIVFPWRQSPGLLHWLIWMVLPEEGWCGRPGRKSADSPCWHFLLPLLHPQLAVSRVLSPSSPLPISYWFHNKLYAIIVNTSQWKIFQYCSFFKNSSRNWVFVRPGCLVRWYNSIVGSCRPGEGSKTI